MAFAGLPSKALGVDPIARGGAAAIFAMGGFGTGGGFPPGGGGGACWIWAGLCTVVGGFCTGGGFPPGGGGACEVEAYTGADKGGMELI